MSKGLNTTVFVGGTILALFAVGTGANAQGANEYGYGAGKPIVEWETGSDGQVPVFKSPRREPRVSYSETVQERSQSTSATGDTGATSPKRKVRSGD